MLFCSCSQQYANEILENNQHYTLKKEVLQNPLSYKKGSAFYPKAKPLKKGSEIM
jgi:hypothetical protein